MCAADSGYPGSISSSSSQGQKSLKSPQDISPSYNNFSLEHQPCKQYTSTPAVPPLQEQCRGSINTAELGLFSPEIMDTTQIANFPMPPDPQWVWPVMGGAMRVEPESLLDSVSETTSQSLFDPSKMVIAKVESLSDDSRFNDYLNEILESEEVMECLNSISSDPAPSLAVEPPEMKIKGAESPPPVSAVTTLPAGVVHKEEEALSSAPYSTATPSTGVSTTAAELHHTTTTTAITVGNSSPSESVAAYVAAETNLVPFSVGDCLTGTSVEPATRSPKPPQSTGPVVSLLGGVSSGASLVTVATPATTLSSLHGGVGSDIMWSQSSGAVDGENTGIDPPVADGSTALVEEESPHSVVDEDKNVSPESQPREKSTKQPPSDHPPSSTGASVAPKKTVFRLKREKTKSVVEGSISGATGTTGGGQETQTDERGKCSPSGGQVGPQDLVKSRTGRAIKPSWKLVQASSNQALKRTTSPKEKLSPPAKVGGEKASDAPAQPKSRGRSGKTGGVRKIQREESQAAKSSAGNSGPPTTSLSLAAVVGAKKLPDIPTTDCSTSLSLPPASDSLSMSLDDILRQMNDNDPSEQSAVAEFAESLLTTASDGSSGGKEGDRESVEEGSSDKSCCQSVGSQPLKPQSGSSCNVKESGSLGECGSQSKPDGLFQPSQSPLERPEYTTSRSSDAVPRPGKACPSPIRWTTEEQAPPTSHVACGSARVHLYRVSTVTASTGMDSGSGKGDSTTLELTESTTLDGIAALTESDEEGEETLTESNRVDQSAVSAEETNNMSTAADTLEEETIAVNLHQPADDGTEIGRAMEEESSDTRPPDVSASPARSEERDHCSPATMDLCSVSEDEDNEEEPPSFQTLVTSPLILEEGGGGGEELGADIEDQIDIFPDDFDTFTVYTMDEKTKKNRTPPRMPSPPSELRHSMCVYTNFLYVYRMFCCEIYTVFCVAQESRHKGGGPTSNTLAPTLSPGDLACSAVRETTLLLSLQLSLRSFPPPQLLPSLTTHLPPSLLLLLLLLPLLLPPSLLSLSLSLSPHPNTHHQPTGHPVHPPPVFTVDSHYPATHPPANRGSHYQ